MHPAADPVAGSSPVAKSLRARRSIQRVLRVERDVEEIDFYILGAGKIGSRLVEVWTQSLKRPQAPEWHDHKREARGNGLDRPLIANVLRVDAQDRGYRFALVNLTEFRLDLLHFSKYGS